MKLKGTEKQVRWAEEIRAKMKDDAEKAISLIEKRDGWENVRIAVIRRERMKAVLAKIHTEENAVWYIDNRGDCTLGIGKMLLGR